MSVKAEVPGHKNFTPMDPLVCSNFCEVDRDNLVFIKIGLNH